MALLKAPIYGIDAQLRYGKVGDFIWDGDRLYTELRESEKLLSILRPYELASGAEVDKFDPNENPEAWIQNLYRYYLSVELRAYRANEVKPLKSSASQSPRTRWSQSRKAR